MKYLDKIGDRKKVAETFEITLRTLANWIRRKKEDKLAPKPRRSSPSLIDSEKLRSFIQKHPDAYLREIAKEFGSTLQDVFYACKRLKISLKKKTPYYEERNEEKRDEFLKEIEKISEQDRICLDESGINKYLKRERARSLRGSQVYGAISGMRYARESFIAA